MSIVHGRPDREGLRPGGSSKMGVFGNRRLNSLNRNLRGGEEARPPGSGAGTNAREPGPTIIFNRKKHLHFSSVRYGPTHRDTTPRH